MDRKVDPPLDKVSDLFVFGDRYSYLMLFTSNQRNDHDLSR